MFWVSLISLLSALASQEEEVRYEQGQPLGRTVFDVIGGHPEFQIMVDRLSGWLSTVPPEEQTFEGASYWLASQLGIRPNDPSFSATAAVVYGLARAQPYRSIWKLDPAAYEALTQTVPPWDLVSQELPRLPFPAVLVRLPDDQAIQVLVREMPIPVPVRSMLVIEEIPGKKWRYLGFNDASKIEKFIFTRGWFDISSASANAQLVQGMVPTGDDYRLTNEDAVWQLLINLFLVTRYDHLEGQRVRPKFPRGSEGKRLRRETSGDDYVVVRLSKRTTDQIQELEQESTGPTTGEGRPTPRRHLVAGHWKSVWVIDPADKPVYATKPRVGHQGQELGGFLYKVATWVPPFWKGTGDGRPQGRYLVKPG
jgi:hypothetical protein